MAPGALAPGDPQTEIIALEACSLHAMSAGEGEILIMVPATLSELENWRDLVRFMGQWFHAYFFELPGHGKSSALRGPFTSDKVAEAVEQLADRLHAHRFSLMGFSFGGILAMKTYARLQARIDRLILLAPCLTSRALQLSEAQRAAAAALNGLLKRGATRELVYGLLHSRRGSEFIASVVNLIGRVENRRYLARKLQELRPSVMEIVSHEMDEMLNFELPAPAHKAETACYFAMSYRDPLLSYETTLRAARRQFADVQVTTLDYPFHQPPEPFTLEELNAAFGERVERFLREDGLAIRDVPAVGRWAPPAAPVSQAPLA